ncbi:MAG TPA: spermidine/putrescine ABC transporter substrate-binding protein [Actinomycetes bacterium]|jgi:spermidine/putrescine transport system substrate-binding protein|nr:spermidine/putrescine ABC transporter substrate-binding protein [Actinomycetes bacterium]
MARDPLPPTGRMSRRAFLALSGGVVLAGCGGGGNGGGGGAAGGAIQLASPSHPVTWPIRDDNKPIADGLAPERNATLKVYNWTDYIYKKVVSDFEKRYKAYGVKVQVSTYATMSEAIAKIRSGQVAFDVLFPTYDVLGKLIQRNYVRPLTHSYLGNIGQVWPVFQNPFYDQGWRYSVPYTVYTTGIAWRTDKGVPDVAKQANPYAVLWDQRLRGKVGILDDYREAIGMVLLKNGITDLNTGNPDQINLARDQLVDLAKKIRPLVSTNDYVDLPEGRTWVTQAWSGDMVNAQYYMPKGQSAGVIRYWFPPDGRGAVNSDLIVLLRSGRNPVLGHLFLDHLLDYDVALENMGWNGYQPPQTKLDPAKLVQQELIPANLKPTTVLPDYFDSGFRELELAPDVDSLWHAAWQEFKAGA